MPSQHSANVTIGQSITIAELAVLHLSYRILWDKGSLLTLLVYDPDCAYHKALQGIGGSPNPPISFQLSYDSSAGFSYLNKGTKRTVYMVKARQVTTAAGLCLAITAMDKASILLRGAAMSLSSPGVKASDFVQQIAAKVGLNAIIPSTGDNAQFHKAIRFKPIDAIRYELDRVLSSGGKPLSLQFDDGQAQVLKGYEELYDAPTQLLAKAMTGGQYTYGVAVSGNGKANPMSYGNALYHWDMTQDYRPAIWGHKVSVDHLTSKGEVVTGSASARLSGNLGIQGDALSLGERRLAVPAGPPDSATSDAYYASAVMTNTVFQTEMRVTHGWTMIDSDYTAYDSPDILNRYHILIALTGGSNKPSGTSILPDKAVVMGWEHRLNQESAFTRVHLRRG